ncbi:hypothetical protein B0T26DRAFT_631020 [Lasiosphaeria miniovina]|uniref:Helix-turn-helix domain-containing protein n=1 Tax=Lasiosphaeria miniovina TaxID=1954250 RepID=A0AA40BH84_9PEZI|nr:uncharacterized protein B0T26DRAFT_631020 [Lasiosphaeria miniovina]KAK0734191.1 hypothetical protein B0T26DRAFT_631020 [Lasiosphaeria miniovina]
MGVAEPNPTYSPSSIATPAPDPSAFRQRDHGHAPSAPRFAPAAGNATLGVLEARQRLEELAEREFADMGRSGGDQGKEFLDVATIRDALVLRQRGTPAAEIEKRLRLKQGVVARLGRPGLVSPTS